MLYGNEVPPSVETYLGDWGAGQPLRTKSSESKYYEGEYEVIPMNYSQILSTKNKILVHDILVREIAFHEVQNKSGGTTITIGGE